MNQRLFDIHRKYKRKPDCMCVRDMGEFWGGLILTLVLIYCASVIWDAVTHKVADIDVLHSERGVMYMWEYESTPADRAAILNKLSAKECIDAGLCELVVKLPITEW